MKKITDQYMIMQYIEKYNLEEVLDLEALLKGHIMQYQKGDVILRCGEKIEYFSFFLEGKLKVLSVLENGKSLLLRFYTELDTLGDIELFYPGPIDSSVEAVSESYILHIPLNYVRDNYFDNPKFLRYIGKSLSDKLKSISRNSAYNLYYPLINRLSSYIYEHIGENDQVVFYSSFQDISEFLGTTYRHLNRTLNELSEMKVIRIKGKKVDVLDVNALKALAKNLYR